VKLAVPPLLPIASLACLLAAAAGSAVAQTPPPPSKHQIEDNSSAQLLPKGAAEAIWRDNVPLARIARAYPAAKWGFLSQVEGGLVGGQVCVVTARAAMLPLTMPTRRLVWEPRYMSTTFDTKAGATAQQCSELAAAKLKEAIQSLATNLVKT
jgi:hypothetical protein